MALTKIQHWQTRAFHEFLISRARAPFVWGVNDCALFAADGVLAITGVDIASEFRGRYTSEAEALALIHTLTGGSTIAGAAAYCAAKHEMPERLHPLKAQRGDLVVIADPDDGGALKAALVHLNGVHVVVPGAKGLLRLNFKTIQRAWAYV